MKQLEVTKMPKLPLPSVLASLMVLTLGTACAAPFTAASSDGNDESDAASDAAHPIDGGESTDGGDPTDGRESTDGSQATDGHASTDGSEAADSHAATGGDGSADSASSTDAPTTPPTPVVNLRTAANYAILAMSALSTVPASAITGDVAVSPAAATLITGFSLTIDPTNVFSTSSQVTGKVYAANYTVPTPSNLTTAIGDMQLAFTDAAGRVPDVIGLGAGSIGGMTISPGVYEWASSVDIPASVTLTGSATDVWIFQIANNLTMSSATSVLLAGGALPQNIFWEVAGFVELGTTAHLEGIVLTQTAVTLDTGASVNGRLLAQTAVNIASSVVVAPSP